MPDPERSGPSTAIVVNGTPYLVDFGTGVVRQAVAARKKGVRGLEPVNLRIAFLTHLHSDHTLGFPDLILTPWVVGRKEPLEVYGPPGTSNMAEHILKAYEADKVATLIPAFSRVKGYRHRYVQHALEASADEVWAAMQQDAVVFVCGNASTMAPGVRAALVAVFRAKTGAGEADSEAWLAGLRASNRYLEDIWGETAVV